VLPPRELVRPPLKAESGRETGGNTSVLDAAPAPRPPLEAELGGVKGGNPVVLDAAPAPRLPREVPILCTRASLTACQLRACVPPLPAISLVVPPPAGVGGELLASGALTNGLGGVTPT
jgi:hypothetical protein